MEDTGNPHYYVLYTAATWQSKLKTSLVLTMPESLGRIFYPCMETYRRGKAEPVLFPLFPGYVFIRTKMDPLQLHELARTNRRVLSVYIRELGFERAMDSGQMDPAREEEEFEFGDLSAEETKFLDFLLGIDPVTGELMEGSAGDGILHMSCGYKAGKSFVVMEGPLKYYADHIKDVNIHDRKAYLDFGIKDRVIKAGFEIKPRSHWFPEMDDGVILEDGSELNVDRLLKKMRS